MGLHDHPMLRDFLDRRVRDGVTPRLPPLGEARDLRSRMREICTSGSAGGPGGAIPWGYPTAIALPNW